LQAKEINKEDIVLMLDDERTSQGDQGQLQASKQAQSAWLAAWLRVGKQGVRAMRRPGERGAPRVLDLLTIGHYISFSFRFDCWQKNHGRQSKRGRVAWNSFERHDNEHSTAQHSSGNHGAQHTHTHEPRFARPSPLPL
jgi:hypothetical protein